MAVNTAKYITYFVDMNNRLIQYEKGNKVCGKQSAVTQRRLLKIEQFRSVIIYWACVKWYVLTRCARRDAPLIYTPHQTRTNCAAQTSRRKWDRRAAHAQYALYETYDIDSHFVASELKDPIWHSLEWQIGSFSSEATIWPAAFLTCRPTSLM